MGNQCDDQTISLCDGQLCREGQTRHLPKIARVGELFPHDNCADHRLCQEHVLDQFHSLLIMHIHVPIMHCQMHMAAYITDALKGT